ncbi:MAG: efflux RND transporter permease subunit [Thermoanaerobaculia bacterium]|nr:efflux RND transporter permease subunit [Thermoanaerobaculia bacterium]
MNLTRTSLRHPSGVAIAVAMAVVFGLFSLRHLPVQLLPAIEYPQLSVQTDWRAASPLEMESEILEPQEEVLQGLPGLEELSSVASAGNATINLRFGLGTDMTETLIEVLGRLNRLPPLPADADPPSVRLGGDQGDSDALVWFFVQVLPGTEGSPADFRRLVEDQVKPRFETVPGVTSVDVFAGPSEQVRITFDPFRVADLGLEIPGIARLVGRANDVSAGFAEVGRRQYQVRFAGRYAPADLAELILEWRDGKPVRLGDVAQVEVMPGDRESVALQNGNPAIPLRLVRDSDANVLSSLTQAKAVAADLRDGLLAEHGLDIQPSFDASVFILRAVRLVASNLALGVLLAVGVLWFFLRQGRATLLVALAIPLSLCCTFVVLRLADRSLNVISLAGLAFAVGMVLDAAIVVLENVVRLRERGVPADEAAERGTLQVWGALLASTATTIAIFVPVMYLQDVEGQLFADLALTIAIAVGFSLLVAVTVLPAAAGRFLREVHLEDHHETTWSRIAGQIIRLTDSPLRRASWIGVLLALPVAVTAWLLPDLDYLPPVKRDAVDVFFEMPPGANPKTVEEEMVAVIVDRLEPYMQGRREPALRNYFFWGGNRGAFLGVRAADQRRVDELMRLVGDETIVGIPDTQAFIQRGNLFGGFDSGRGIDVHLQSRDADALLAAARNGMDLLAGALPGATIRPQPALELAQPELRLEPVDARIVESGWTREVLGRVVRALGDGLWLGEHFDGERRLDVILRASQWATPEELMGLPLATPAGVVQLAELVEMERTVGPIQLRRVDRRRTQTLVVIPPESMSLEAAMSAVQSVEQDLRGEMPADGAIRYGGSADALRRAVASLGQNFLIALVVLFLLLSALFSSLRDAAWVVLALPLATVGGVVALRVINRFTFQPLDLLTMIGFIILLGLVVNNAILLVHQTRQAEREGEGRRAAVKQALTLRMRPIFTSTLTSIFGMLPLVLIPGPGSAIYRGLAVAIVGGMSVSTCFTLILLPCLLRLGEDSEPTAGVLPGDGILERAA